MSESKPKRSDSRKVVQMEPCRYHDKLDEIIRRIDERVGKIIEMLEKGHSNGDNKK
jgi:hypothetical protein